MFERIILTQINPHVYLMDDNHEATGYIVIGNEKALVIDTMMGYEDVHAVVKSVTDLDIVIISTETCILTGLICILQICRLPRNT